MKKAIVKLISCIFNLDDGKYYHQTEIHECELSKEGFYWFPINDRPYLIALDNLEGAKGISNFSYSYFTTNISEEFEKEMFLKMHELIYNKCEKLKNILEKAKSSEFEKIRR